MTITYHVFDGAGPIAETTDRAAAGGALADQLAILRGRGDQLGPMAYGDKIGADRLLRSAEGRGSAETTGAGSGFVRVEVERS